MKVNWKSLIIATKDNDQEMMKFYTEILGFEKNEMGGVSIDEGFGIFFDRHNKAQEKALEPFRVMLTLTVDDINATYEDLKSKGVEFVRSPEAEEWGGIFATFKDPDGNYLQIFQMKEEQK